MNALEARGVTVVRGGRRILHGVDLRVEPGVLMALAGPNGSGKSTLLRILATLLRPHGGNAQVFGHDVLRAPHDVRATVGYLAHSPGLYDDLTARENLAFAAAMLERDERDVDNVLDRVGLQSAAQRQVRGLSAGMQRRLALARLMLVRPRLLLLDEPYSNLDADGIRLLNEMLVEWSGAGVAALVVLHELAPASSVLHRTLTMRDGCIVAPTTAHRSSSTPTLALAMSTI